MKPRGHFRNYLQLPKGQSITYMMTYAPDRVVYPKWQFWRAQKTHYTLVVGTDKSRVYMIDTVDGYLTAEDKTPDDK